MPNLHYPICNRARLAAVILIACISSTSVVQAQSARPVEVDGLGVVAFDNTGLPAAQPAFARGVLALHSFWYAEARKSFREARRIDPNFALAYWGEALTHDHPIWGGHDVREGRRVLEQLASLPPETRSQWSERERMYLDAVRELFGGGTVRQRRERFEHVMGALAGRFPDDPEAVAFHALMVVANNPNRGDGRTRILDAAAGLESLLESNPAHPGALHYAIHAYDHQELAAQALPIAEQYLRVAPSAFHAVHMPAHIYRHLGNWERVAELCRQAYDVSVAWVQREGLANTERDFHSLRWLHTAYLRLGRYADAREIHTHVADMPADAAGRRQLNRIRSAMLREYRRARG